MVEEESHGILFCIVFILTKPHAWERSSMEVSTAVTWPRGGKCALQYFVEQDIKSRNIYYIR